MDTVRTPTDEVTFTQTLRRFQRPPGPMGYCNPMYMAFTAREAANLPNLVARHSTMRKLRNGHLHSTSTSTLNKTQMDDFIKDGNGLHKRVIERRNEGKFGKRDAISLSNPLYPITTISGPCETTIGGLHRLCSVCPAVTDLGPNKSPRYINELLCGGDEFCGIDGVQGICQNTVIIQDFLMTTDDQLNVYSQPIRACCDCTIFP
ncbi:uncharacterized skeletal organic matrix protein 8-like [Stylophora pistillata]|uniref:uncharacterized skeletal organic matrix protein 8-like n=1 Tax=Stylophora pistillata TaxID=50429 RepID=UPI000C050BAC|nr:uncharacterized skeletal organic matrix protein 8-like [Stylophora pistillata]